MNWCGLWLLRIRRWLFFSKRSEKRSHGSRTGWKSWVQSWVMGRKKELTEEEKVSMLKMLGSEMDKMWVFPKIVVPQNGWFMMENPIKMDDLRVPLFFGNTNLNRLVFPIYLLATGEGSLIPVDGSGIKLTSWGNGSLSHNLTGFYKFPGGWPWDLNHQQ